MGLPQLYYVREKLKAQKSFEGKRIGWKKGRLLYHGGKETSGASGWQMEKGRWVQYHRGKPTGRTEKHRIDTNAFTGTLANVGRVGKAVVGGAASVVGVGPDVLKGTSLNRQSLKLNNKYENAYKTLDEEKGKPNKDNLWIGPSGKERILNENFSPGYGGEAYLDNKGKLRARNKTEVEAYNAKVAAEEEKARLDSRSFGEKLSQSFEKPEAMTKFTDQFKK